MASLRHFVRGFPFPVASLFVASSFVLASCWCGGSHSSPGSGSGCGNSVPLHCDTGTPVLHGHQTGATAFYTCSVECDPGWHDCNGAYDGCESATPCDPWLDFDAATDGALPPATEVALADVPRGLAVCGGVVYVVDGSAVKSFAPGDLSETTLAVLLAPPAGGLACDPAGGGVVFAETELGAVAATLVHVDPDAATVFGESKDPAPGILADDGGVYWPERDDAGGARLVRWSGDAATSLGPVDLSPVDKPFARTIDGTVLLVGGALGSPDDASVPVWDGGLRAIAAGNGLVGVGDGLDGGSSLVGFADGGVAWTKASPRTVRVLRRSGTDTYVGFDDAIGRIDANGNLVMIALTQAHVADVSVDATWVWWVTLGESNEPAKLHRAKR